MEPVNYAIIGGGIAGTYVMWRLARDPTTRGKRIQLFEAGDHLGGRILSVPMPGTPLIAELGAMRYRTDQILIDNLINHLIPAEMRRNEVIDFDVPSKLWFLRGHQLTPNSFGPRNEPTPPYRLTQEERARTPDEMINWGISRALALCQIVDCGTGDEVRRANAWLASLKDHPSQKIAIDNLSPKEWHKFKRYAAIDGKRLNDIGFWNLLFHALSSEGFQLCHDGQGYESIISNWNAAEAIPWFLKDFADTRYLMLRHGMDSIVKYLVADVMRAQREGAQVGFKQNYRAIEVSRSSDGTYEVKFESSRDNPDPEPIRTHHIIFALPKNPLKRIRWFPEDSKWYKDVLEPHLDSVSEHSLFKVYMAYHEPWWSDHAHLGPGSGVIHTDLPIRQVYLLGPKYSTEPSSRWSLVLGAYSDEHYLDFWHPLAEMSRHPANKNFHVHPDLGADIIRQDDHVRETGGRASGRDTVELYCAHRDMVKKVTHQLLDILGIERESAKASCVNPLLVLFKEWADGGWHTWRPHRDPYQFREFLESLKKKSMFICGEAYSTEQGWIEGALKSAELTLKELGVPPPPGLFPDHAFKTYGFDGYDEYISF